MPHFPEAIGGVQEAAGRPFTIPEGGYHGVYLQEAGQRLLATQRPGFADLPEAEGIARCRAAALQLMREDQDADLATFGVVFDVMASEQKIRDEKKVERTLALLAEKGLSFEEDGALWLRTSAYGDDKDRVMRKKDGNLTYFVPDIAYHIDKHERGFHKAIDLWGADHHGYVPRMRAAMVALGYGADFFEAEIIQLVKVVRGGEEVRMSKRSGEFVTLRDLIEWVGVDAARYFFLMRRGDQLVARAAARGAAGRRGIGRGLSRGHANHIPTSWYVVKRRATNGTGMALN